MINKIRFFIGILVLTMSAQSIWAQQEVDCDPLASLPISQGEILVNYGSVTNAFTFRNRNSFTVAQPFINSSVAKDYTLQTGFWSRFLLPPKAPQVQASNGEFPDRVLINWNLDPLSSEPTEGYVVTRDGAFLAEVDRKVTQFIDFNVQAGDIYDYGVFGRNQFGNGPAGLSYGFVNPNGVVTGLVTTPNRNPVPGTVVSLTPIVGTALTFDGIDDYTCVSHTSAVPTDMWTVQAFVKIGDTYDRSGIIDFGSDFNKNYWILTTPSTKGKGIVIGTGDGSQKYEIEYEFPDNPNDWHQVTAAYAAGNLLLYIDGNYITSIKAAIANEPALIHIGSRRDFAGYYKGNIDDVRLYNRPLNSTEILLNKDLTPSKRTPGLVAYWKFDEGIGRRTFDLGSSDMHGYVFGATFTEDHSRVQVGAITDETGFYAVEGINYSKVENFTATPSKFFYSSYALETNAAYESYAELTDFDLPDTSTIHIVIHPYDLVSRQSILSKGSNFDLWLESGQLFLTINGSTVPLGPVAAEYKFITLSLNASTGVVDYYSDGTLTNSLFFPVLGGEWLGDKWQLAGKGSPATDFYTGLIDRVAFFNDFLPLQTIQLHASKFGNGGIDIGHPALFHYFDLNDGTGEDLEDTGFENIGDGKLYNGTWSIIAYNQKAQDQFFRPQSRLVNINYSNTAASGIDFTNESLINVSGVVRFDKTFCYQDSVEILVNERSWFPPIFTNEDGRFSADFEPGSKIRLTPKFVNNGLEHRFSPPFYNVRNLNRPIAGVLFANLTKRIIDGQISGGDSKLSIIYFDEMNPAANDLVRIKVQAANQCMEREIQLDDATGKFSFRELPPIPLEVAVTLHSNPAVYDYLQVQGGQQKDMRGKARDTVDFRYYAPPQVWMEPFEETMCSNGQSTIYPTLEQSSPLNGYRIYNKTIRMYEDYVGGRDWLNNFDLVIDNNLNEDDPTSYEVRDTSAFKFRYYAGRSNIGGDFSKFMQVQGTSPRGDSHVAVQRAIVLGDRPRETSFVTTSPEIPIMILRDPPGDGSSATWEKGQTNCQSWSGKVLTNLTTNSSTSFSAGFDITTFKGLGAGVIDNMKVQSTTDISVETSVNLEISNARQFCVTTNKTITTSAGDAIMGDDADIYFGAAVNFKFSANDVLWLNTETCDIRNDSITITVQPEGFATEFIYSQWQILTSVIPNLELTGFTQSANAWRNIIAYNDELKRSSKFRKNLSFDGLAEFSESIQTVNSNSFDLTTEVTLSASDQTTLDIEIGIQKVFTLGFSIAGGESASEGFSNDASNTIAYTLSDDDPNDSYTVDVLDDPVYGTPVFRLKAGESMCPWVPGTLNREEIGFQIDRVTAVDVPENDAAVFRVQMINLGQTGRDPLVYMIGLAPGSNPDGAIVTMDGEGLINPIIVQLQPRETKEFLVSVEKGPDVNNYNYRDIAIFAASLCQHEHALGLGYNLAAYADWERNNPGVPRPTQASNVMEGFYNIVDLEKFYKQFRLDVFFQEPCSPINIGFPLQDWVQTPAFGDNLTISLNSYNRTDPDLKVVRVQYRRTGGDGAWINITDIDPANLGPVATTVSWDMTELADGPYEIRAVAECFQSSLPAGISAVIKGRKETRPPRPFGRPQPSDGILSQGDEISITFSKRVNCNKIFPADGIGTNINLNNMALQDMTLGGVLIDADFVCKDEKIVVIPRINKRFIEDHTLRVTATAIEDLYGNEADQVSWEFYVNQANLYWEGGAIDEVVLEGNQLVVKREIRNQSGEITSYVLDDFPDWMEIFPVAGTLRPGDIVPVTFTFPANLVTNAYSTVVKMLTIDGEKPLKVDLRVACPEPDWHIVPSNYSFSMNIAAQLNIEGLLSDDRLDIVGAFVDGELRGIGKVQYSRDLERYLVFLTIYSNQAVGETVTFQIWDATACLLYGSTVETFPFVADDFIGSPLVPQILNTNGQLLRKIQIHPGWNWLSYNIELSDPSTNEALALLTNPEGALIKSQTQFSTYSDLTSSWLGDLTQLSHLTMYQYNSLAYDSLIVVGSPVDQTTAIPLVAGWNWIGYLPQYGLPVTDALQSLSPLNGDIIKSQVSFAQYVAGVGWVGNLNFLNTPNGYLIKLSNADILSYPSRPVESVTSETGEMSRQSPPSGYAENSYTLLDLEEGQKVIQSRWNVIPQDYEYSMNAIAIVVDSEYGNILHDGDEVAAFVGNEVRGIGKAMFIPALNKYLLFMTIYANRVGEVVTFKYYNKVDDAEYPIIQNRGFEVNFIWGDVEQPVELELESTSSTNDELRSNHLVIYPNPAGYYVYINFTSDVDDDIKVSITNLTGVEVAKFGNKVQQGQNVIEWKPDLKLPNGLYLVTLKTKNGNISKMAELLR